MHAVSLVIIPISIQPPLKLKTYTFACNYKRLKIIYPNNNADMPVTTVNYL